MVIIYCDGGSRGNPGHSAYGFVAMKDGKTIKEEGAYIGIETNNYAEYTALVRALEYLKNSQNGEEISVFMDSQLVVSQVNGSYKVKSPKLRVLLFKVRELESEFKKITYSHIRREKNIEADRMVNLALDKHLNGN